MKTTFGVQQNKEIGICQNLVKEWRILNGRSEHDWKPANEEEMQQLKNFVATKLKNRGKENS